MFSASLNDIRTQISFGLSVYLEIISEFHSIFCSFIVAIGCHRLYDIRFLNKTYGANRIRTEKWTETWCKTNNPYSEKKRTKEPQNPSERDRERTVLCYIALTESEEKKKRMKHWKRNHTWNIQFILNIIHIYRYRRWFSIRKLSMKMKTIV